MTTEPRYPIPDEEGVLIEDIVEDKKTYGGFFPAPPKTENPDVKPTAPTPK